MFLYKLKLSNEFLVEESETQEIAEQKYGFEICYKAINLICCFNLILPPAATLSYRLTAVYDACIIVCNDTKMSVYVCGRYSH